MSLARLSSAIRAHILRVLERQGSPARLAPVGGVMRDVVLHRAQRTIASGVLAGLGGGFDGG